MDVPLAFANDTEYRQYIKQLQAEKKDLHANLQEVKEVSHNCQNYRTILTCRREQKNWMWYRDSAHWQSKTNNPRNCHWPGEN